MLPIPFLNTSGKEEYVDAKNVTGKNISLPKREYQKAFKEKDEREYKSQYYREKEKYRAKLTKEQARAKAERDVYRAERFKQAIRDKARGFGKSVQKSFSQAQQPRNKTYARQRQSFSITTPSTQRNDFLIGGSMPSWVNSNPMKKSGLAQPSWVNNSKKRKGGLF